MWELGGSATRMVERKQLSPTNCSGIVGTDST